MVSFENFVKSMPPSLSELKLTPSFCFPFKIPDDPTASNIHNTLTYNIEVIHTYLVYLVQMESKITILKNDSENFPKMIGIKFQNRFLRN